MVKYWFKKYYLFDKVTSNNRFYFWVSLDTFKTPEGWDRAIMNSIRAIGIIGTWMLFWYKMPFLIFLPLITLFIGIAGITKFKYFNNKKEIIMTFWR